MFQWPAWLEYYHSHQDLKRQVLMSLPRTRLVPAHRTWILCRQQINRELNQSFLLPKQASNCRGAAKGRGFDEREQFGKEVWEAPEEVQKFRIKIILTCELLLSKLTGQINLLILIRMMYQNKKTHNKKTKNN
jgi:hypothetical protein